MRGALAVAAGLLALAVACASSPAEPAADPAAVADVRFLAAELERVHPDLFHTLSRQDFRRQVDDLAARAPALERDQLLVELMRLLAQIGPREGHLGLFPLVDHERPLRLAPLRVWEFPEGYHVVASPTDSTLVGARVVAIAGRPVEVVAALVRPLITRDNDASLRLRVPEFMLTGEVLHGLGLAPSADEVRLTVERRDGTRADVTLPTVAGPAYWGLIQHVWALPPPPGVRTPLWLRDQETPLHLSSLDGGRVLYVRYSHVMGRTAPIAERLVARARHPKVRRVIVDVRINPGGDNTTYYPLLWALQRKLIDRPGRLVVLTGRVTFSAAGNFAAHVDATTKARVVGETAGGSPHNYGDTTEVELEHLGWTVHVPTVYAEVLGRTDERVTLPVDVPAQLGVADYLAGRDTVLWKAVSLR